MRRSNLNCRNGNKRQGNAIRNPPLKMADPVEFCWAVLTAVPPVLVALLSYLVIVFTGLFTMYVSSFKPLLDFSNHSASSSPCKHPTKFVTFFFLLLPSFFFSVRVEVLRL